YAANFANANKNNEVLINVWGYDPKWTVSVTENGRSLAVQRVSSYDPLQIISYAMRRLNVNATPTFDAANTSHMFKVKTSAANTTLQIKVTDRFGNTYSESMERPKTFTYSMR
ncbi:calcineurin-like phosphoesterase C-terminal domain-containing protein, partial [Brucella sp. 21LCYQ03]|nr:calcineurin-like phosphoesterase C-terminal domain-containing protein [Brucella sp. 21LCYQ03]